jgi:ABC-type transport system substrate-binding protein
MGAAKVVRAACVMLALALLGSACGTPPRDTARNGVHGGTLQVLSDEESMGGLDTVFLGPLFARAYARTLYGYNLSGPPEQRLVPVPDIASGPPKVSADRRTYTFTLRPGVRYAPRSTAKSPPRISSLPSNASTTRSTHRPSSPTTSSPGRRPTGPARPPTFRA